MARRSFVAPIVIALAAAAPAAEPERALRERVDAAIERGVDHLRDRRRSLGGIGSESVYPLGVECLAFYTLRVCGVPPDDAFVGWLEAQARTAVSEAPHTYTVSLALLGLLLSDRERHASRIVEAITRIEAGQLKQEDAGAWGYLLPLGRTTGRAGGQGTAMQAAHWPAPPDWWDNSNSQIAVLALRSAVDFGFSVEPAVLRRAAEHFLAVQRGDGGFAYDEQGHRTRSYVAMTAGVGGSLVMCRDLLGDDASDRALRRTIDRALRRARGWLGRRLSYPTPDSPWPYYAAYAVERYGHYAGVDRFGDVDWYADGAAWLLDAQRRDGGWDTQSLAPRSRSRGGRDDRPFVTTASVSDTCFALLFLRRSSFVHTRVSDEVRVLLRSVDAQARPAELEALAARIVAAGDRKSV
ncbi:MAG: hypothetical protein ACF8XB_02860, partial [Planctomycetota bacterium JB042]